MTPADPARDSWSALPVSAVSAARTAKAAAVAIVDHLAQGGLMPSVYFAREGRLRCQAVRGYWQIYDGMPPTAGVIGQTYRTGEETVVLDVSTHEGYLPAIGEVRAEVCLPLCVHGRPVGVLNLEAPFKLTDDAVEHVRRCARLLEHRVRELGTGDEASAAQRLARRAVRLAALTSTDEIVHETVDAACAVSGLGSGMLVLRDAQNALHVCAATGGFSPVFSDLDPAALATMGEWVDHGTSSYTIGDPAGFGFAGHETLRDAGARTLLVLPLEASGRRLGFIALAEREARTLATEDVELLELLASHAAGALRTAAAVAELRRLASTDPLTGLGHHATFHTALRESRRTVHEGRRVAVVLADLDGFKALNDTRGHAAGDAELRELSDLLQALLPAGAQAFRVGGDEFAVLLEVTGVVETRRLATALQTAAKVRLSCTLSVGAAIGESTESDAGLLERADAALYEVKRAGRDGVALAT
jgi:diguanylate cyclase (GGDEF)-like protein